MSCRHQPIFKFKMLFAQKPKYKCRHCDAAIEMVPQTKMFNRVINFAFVAVMAFMIIGGNKVSILGLSPLLTYIGTVLIFFLIYLLLAALLINFGKYQEIAAVEIPASPEETEKPMENPQYSEEQLEIMTMYEQVEKQARIDAGMDPLPDAPIEHEAAPADDLCEHTPAASWKNYMPGKFEFVCANCSKPILFKPKIKKNINMLLLIVMFLILMPNMMNTDINMWMFGLYTLLAFAIGIVIQLFFVKKGKFDLKLPGTK